MARHKTMRGFSKRIKEIAVGVEKNGDNMVRKTVITAASAVALGTPVDEGRARANWQTQIGSAPGGVVSDFPKGSKGSTAAAAAGMATSAAVAEMAGYHHSGTEVYISNSLPYIGPLNAGSSTQAPAGFVEKAVVAAVNAIKKARLVK